MTKDLTTSAIDRQNILNNAIALPKIQESLDVKFYEFQGKYVITRQQVADFYEVDVRTIDRCIKANEEEIMSNGYFLCKGNALKEFKLRFGSDIDVATKTTLLGLFDFRAFLNVGMLLTDSEKAKMLRSKILDIVLYSIYEKTGGNTKYINRRDSGYLASAIIEENYHKNLTDAINKYVEGHKTFKYAQVTDLIYKAVFCEKAKEYKQLLALTKKDNIRHTLYSEVLTAVSAFENGAADEITRRAQELGRSLSIAQVGEIVEQLAAMPFGKPIVEDARVKMASRDNALRNVYHGNLAAYIRAVMPEEYQKFLGDTSNDFDRLLEENKDVLDHLKQ
ncbi:MAG: ORF6N domain-containing protein [Bacteroidales bacterium]|jgi:hypothetical protein|nr:ORF6N domain-containing protein [Bacteroidales bacterium]